MDPLQAHNSPLDLSVMARVRNKKQGSSTKPSHKKKLVAESESVGDSGDEENLVTEAQEISDVSICTRIHLCDSFSSSGLFE